MSEQTIYANPFRKLAETLRQLRQTFTVEAGLQAEGQRKLTPALGETLGAMNGLINSCDETAGIVDRLERADLDAFEALQRALEKTA